MPLGKYLISLISNQIKSNTIYLRRDIIHLINQHYKAPVALKKKDKRKHRYGIDGVVVNGFGRSGGFDRGEQGSLSFKYDL